MQNGQWIRFKCGQNIPGAHSVDGWLIGVWYGPDASVAANVNRIFPIDAHGKAIRKPLVRIDEATEIHACTNPLDLPAERLSQMGPVTQWIPRWPGLEAVDG